MLWLETYFMLAKIAFLAGKIFYTTVVFLINLDNFTVWKNVVLCDGLPIDLDVVPFASWKIKIAVGWSRENSWPASMLSGGACVFRRGLRGVRRSSEEVSGFVCLCTLLCQSLPRLSLPYILEGWWWARTNEPQLSLSCLGPHPNQPGISSQGFAPWPHPNQPGIHSQAFASWPHPNQPGIHSQGFAPWPHPN